MCQDQGAGESATVTCPGKRILSTWPMPGTGTQVSKSKPALTFHLSLHRFK